MNMYKILPAIGMISLSLIFFNCESVTSPVSSITGVVYSLDHVPIENLKVTVDGRSVFTSNDGRFAFDAISFPYDLIITDSLNRTVVVHKGLSVNNIELPLFRYANNNNYAGVNVQIPEEIFQPDTKGVLLFTDGNFINSYTEVNEFHQNIGFNVALNNNSSVMGKLIALFYKEDNNGNIISYDNYGEIPGIQLVDGSNFNFAFDSASLSLNPGEQTINCSINIQAQPYFTKFYLNFASKNSLFKFKGIIFSYLSGNHFNFKIPTGLPSSFSTIVNNQSYTNSGSSIEDFSVFPESPNDLIIKIPPQLISPEDNTKNVNISTPFSFNTGSGNGVYEISLHNMSRNIEYTIVTSDNNFTLEGLEDLGFGRINNNNFNWKVRKIGPATSLNEYVSGFFNEQNQFYSQSEYRNFSTEP